MRVLIVYAHPEPRSFNAAMRDAAVAALEAAGHAVTVSDLYGEGFAGFSGRGDFIGAADADRFAYQAEQARAVTERAFAPEIAREQRRIERCDLLILQFPMWWFGPPAILKSWIDRVLAFGFAYDLSSRYDRGKLRGRRALVSVTTGGTPERFSDTGLYGDIERVLYPLHKGVLQYVGMELLDPFVAYAAPRGGDANRRAILDAYATRLGGIDRERGRPLPAAGPRFGPSDDRPTEHVQESGGRP